MRSITSAALAISIGVVSMLGSACAGEAAGTERAILYEENRTPTGAQYDGAVTWTAEAISPGAERIPAVRACITIPPRGLNIALLLQPRFVSARAPDYVISISLNAPNDFPPDAVPRLAGLLMKPAATAHGAPITGDWLKVANNRFELSLSPQRSDFGRNVQLLKAQAWLSLAIVYRDGRRAIVAVEKGSSGTRAMRAAFAAWGASAAPRPDAALPPGASPKDQATGCDAVVSRDEELRMRALELSTDDRRAVADRLAQHAPDAVDTATAEGRSFPPTPTAGGRS